MIAAQEAGAPLQEFIETDSIEFMLWDRFSKEGPSTVRTQILLAQIIQMIGSALGGQATPIDKLLPYYNAFMGLDTPRGKRAQAQAKRAKQSAIHQSAVDAIVAKAKERANGT